MQHTFLARFSVLGLIIFLLTNQVCGQPFQTGDSIIVQRLKLISDQMPLPWFEEISKSVAERMHAFETYQMLNLFVKEFPNIQKICIENEIPEAFAVLPLVMSKMDNLSFTERGKAGLWGLDAAAAVFFGLEINNRIDQRYDPYKATFASLSYLKLLHDELNDWWFTLIAFTQSPVIARLWMDTDTLNQGGYYLIKNDASLRNNQYVIDFIFFNYLINFYDEHLISLSAHKESEKQQLVAVPLKQPVNASDFFRVTGLNLNTFRKYNPVYISGNIDPKLMVYALPKNMIDSFLIWEDSLYFWFEHPRNLFSKQQPETIYYIVKSGDTLGKIASKHNVTVNQLKEWNSLKSDIIRPGQKLIIKKRDLSQSALKVNESTSNCCQTNYCQSEFSITIKSTKNYMHSN